MQTKWFCLMNKINVDFKSFVGLGKTDVRPSISTQLSSFTTVSNPGTINHYARSVYEPNWQKSIAKFSF